MSGIIRTSRAAWTVAPDFLGRFLQDRAIGRGSCGTGSRRCHGFAFVRHALRASWAVKAGSPAFFGLLLGVSGLEPTRVPARMLAPRVREFRRFAVVRAIRESRNFLKRGFRESGE